MMDRIKKIRSFKYLLAWILVVLLMSSPILAEDLVVDLTGDKTRSLKLGFEEDEPPFPPTEIEDVVFEEEYARPFAVDLTNEIISILDEHEDDFPSDKILAVASSWGFPDNLLVSVLTLDEEDNFQDFHFDKQVSLPQFSQFTILRADYGVTFCDEQANIASDYFHFLATREVVSPERNILPAIDFNVISIEDETIKINIITSGSVIGEVWKGAKGKVGLLVVASEYGKAFVDMVGPSCALDIYPADPNGENNWYKVNPTVIGKVTDDRLLDRGVDRVNLRGHYYGHYKCETNIKKLDTTKYRPKFLPPWPSLLYSDPFTVNLDGYWDFIVFGRDMSLWPFSCSSGWREVKVDTHDPIAVVSPSSQTVNVGESATFDGSASHDVTSGIDHYEWWFGDGTVETGTGNPGTTSHTYASVGTYTVTLKLWDKAGNDGTGTAQAQVGVEVIPEFSTIVIPIVTIMGLLFLISRRKQKR